MFQTAVYARSFGFERVDWIRLLVISYDYLVNVKPLITAVSSTADGSTLGV